MWTKQNVLSILRKAGPVVGFVLVLALLGVLIWLTHGSNTYASVPMLISGRPFKSGFKYPSEPIRLWYIGVTGFMVVAVPCTVLARWLSQRKTRLAYWSFAIPTAILYVYLLVILTIPFSWLIRYIDSMGFTPKRIHALFYGLGGYIVISSFLCWALKRPKVCAKPSSGQE